jgi:hypothetical protein
MSKNQTSILADERWVIQRRTRQFKRHGRVFESWRTLSRPLGFDVACARAAQLDDHAQPHRLITGVEECVPLFSRVVEVVA